MILHLGGDVAVPVKDVIAIFCMESSLVSDINKEFLDVARDEGFVREISEDDHKAFVLAEVDKKTVIFYSPISAATLRKRINYKFLEF